MFGKTPKEKEDTKLTVAERLRGEYNILVNYRDFVKKAVIERVVSVVSSKITEDFVYDFIRTQLIKRGELEHGRKIGIIGGTVEATHSSEYSVSDRIIVHLGDINVDYPNETGDASVSKDVASALVEVLKEKLEDMGFDIVYFRDGGDNRMMSFGVKVSFEGR